METSERFLPFGITWSWEVSCGPVFWSCLSHLRGTALMPGWSTKSLSSTQLSPNEPEDLIFLQEWVYGPRWELFSFSFVLCLVPLAQRMPRAGSLHPALKTGAPRAKPPWVSWRLKNPTHPVILKDQRSGDEERFLRRISFARAALWVFHPHQEEHGECPTVRRGVSKWLVEIRIPGC